VADGRSDKRLPSVEVPPQRLWRSDRLSPGGARQRATPFIQTEVRAMANNNAPFGLAAYGGPLGAAYNGELREVKIAAGDTNKIFFGDPVKQLNTGYVAAWTAGTEVSQLAGIFAGCKYLSSVTGKWEYSRFWPGGGNTGDALALIVPCTGGVPLKFRAQSSGAAFTQADIGINADVVMNAGNAATGLSAAALNQATLGPTATLPFRIVGLYPGVDNGGDHTTPYNHAVVVANVSGAGATGI
jgi:hypothetical protein